jgi:hypothetical protein
MELNLIVSVTNVNFEEFSMQFIRLRYFNITFHTKILMSPCRRVQTIDEPK